MLKDGLSRVFVKVKKISVRMIVVVPVSKWSVE